MSVHSINRFSTVMPPQVSKISKSPPTYTQPAVVQNPTPRVQFGWEHKEKPVIGVGVIVASLTALALLFETTHLGITPLHNWLKENGFPVSSPANAPTQEPLVTLPEERDEETGAVG